MPNGLDHYFNLIQGIFVLFIEESVGLANIYLHWVNMW